MICFAMVIFAAGLFLLKSWETEHFRVEPVEQDVVITTDHRPPIQYKGTTYLPRADVRSYLFMGIDKDGPAENVSISAGGGQADFLLLLVVDDQAKTQQMLLLNRDTVTRVPVLGMMGTVVGYEYQQLALAHFYGDGRHKSCVNVVDAVSYLLGNQPISGYASLYMDGMTVLNDAVGGVTVTIEDDFTGVDDTLVLGGNVTLHGVQAEHFLRSRMSMKDDPTNLARMDRQRHFLQALSEKLARQSQQQFIRTYDAVTPYLVTNLGSGEWQSLAKTLQEYAAQPICQLTGHTGIVGGTTAFYADEDNLIETIIRLFYRPA